LRVIGFGGQDFKNYRLWLDDDLESGSYVNADDTTYEKGYLADPATRKYNVSPVLFSFKEIQD
jgi:TLD.